MPTIDTSTIEGFEGMSAEQKVEALLKAEIPEKVDLSLYVSKDTADKYATEAAELKKQLKSRMTDDEAAKAQADADRKALEDKYTELLRKSTIAEHTARYIAMPGYDEKLARELADKRTAEAKEKQFAAYTKVTLDNLFDQMAANDMKELPIVVKADVQGSAEAVKQSLEKISNDEVRVRVIHAGVGAISKSDVSLADASNAIIIGFNVRPDAVAKAEAEQTGVEMRMYRVIYDAINDVSDAMKGMLAPKVREVALGEAQVRQVYKISSVGTVAGCRVTDGKITRDAQLRLVRDGIVICEDSIASLKRFKDDAKEVAEGFECGITLAKFQDIKEGDVFECFKMEEYRD